MNKINFFLMLRNLKKLRQYAILNIIGFSLSLPLTLFAIFCILNETRRKIFSIGQRSSETEYTVVGVVRDFHYSSAHEKIEPFMIHMRCSRMTDILVRLNEGDGPEVLSNVRRVWNEVEPNILFDYAFVKDLSTRLNMRKTVSWLRCSPFSL